jgi:ABC-type antimicrobial peptide transport system ATPase subunit
MISVSVARYRPADNPFASHRIDGLAYRTTEFEVASLCRRLENLRDRAAIVGPQGSGKTTLLEELASVLPGEPVLIRVQGWCRHPWRTVRAQLPRSVTLDQAVFVDGAEQLGPIGWRLLLCSTRPARSLVATLHRPGLLPTLVECKTNSHLLNELVEELAPADVPALEPNLEELFYRHNGDIRLCLRELYDVYAGRVAPLSS